MPCWPNKNEVFLAPLTRPSIPILGFYAGSWRLGGSHRSGPTSAFVCRTQRDRIAGFCLQRHDQTWIAPSEPVDDLEQGKQRAAAHAQQYLRLVGNFELPPLRWKESRSA